VYSSATTFAFADTIYNAETFSDPVITSKDAIASTRDHT
jgi:hypothetical protein